MVGTEVVAVYRNGAITEAKKSTFSVKVGLAQMLRGGVIMEVVNADHPQLIKEIKNAVTIPVMPKAWIGHFIDAQILEAIGIDYVDESEVLTLADDKGVWMGKLVY